MKMSKLLTLYLTFMLVVNILSEKVSEEEIDPVIDFLLNGKLDYDETVTDEPRIPTAGIWKCGNCTDLDDSKIVYSEENYIDTDDENSTKDVETKIELILDGMRCVTVSADKPGVVQRLTGSCNEAVTLYMTPARHFVVHVYV